VRERERGGGSGGGWNDERRRRREEKEGELEHRTVSYRANERETIARDDSERERDNRWGKKHTHPVSIGTIEATSLVAEARLLISTHAARAAASEPHTEAKVERDPVVFIELRKEG
jgi:hypothetical protein